MIFTIRALPDKRFLALPSRSPYSLILPSTQSFHFPPTIMRYGPLPIVYARFARFVPIFLCLLRLLSSPPWRNLLPNPPIFVIGPETPTFLAILTVQNTTPVLFRLFLSGLQQATRLEVLPPLSGDSRLKIGLVVLCRSDLPYLQSEWPTVPSVHVLPLRSPDHFPELRIGFEPPP